MRPEQVQQAHGYRSMQGGLSGRWLGGARGWRRSRARRPGGAGGSPVRSGPASRSVPQEAGVPGAALRVQDLEVRRAAPAARGGCGRRSRRCAGRPRPGPAGSSPSAPAPAAGRSPPRRRPPGPGRARSAPRTTSSVPARLASAASRPSRSPTRTPLTAGSRPSGRSTTRRSTVRAARSAAESARASSRSTGVSTTSHSGRMPRATASTGSKARARSSQATIAPVAWASAATRSASVVLPDEASPRSATVADRGSPPVPRMASRAANPVGTTRPVGVRGRLRGPGRGGRRPGRQRDEPGSGERVARVEVVRVVRAASAPGRARPRPPARSSPPRRGAAAPQRAWSVASASETSDERAIGRRILEQMFYSGKGFGGFDRPRATPRRPAPPRQPASSARPSHCVARGRSPSRHTAYATASTGPNELARPTSHVGATSRPIA